MSFFVRRCHRATSSSTIYLTKRQAHKKSALQVKLNEFVEGVGIKDEIVSVRPGLMRNILYPTGKATYVVNYNGPRNRILESKDNHNHVENHLEQQHKAEQRQHAASRLLGGLDNVHVLTFNRAVVPNSDATFGSVTVDDLVLKLKEEYDLTIDKQAILVTSEGGRIKSLGDHLVQVQIGDKLKNITIKVQST